MRQGTHQDMQVGKGQAQPIGQVSSGFGIRMGIHLC
jgi:hypothetical protein